MKKLISLSIFIMLFAVLAQASKPAKKPKQVAKKAETAAPVSAPAVQGPGIVFTNLSYDFGQVKEEDGPVSTVFEFTNNGTEPLILSEVHASCGCTTPDWTKEPVAPGAKGFVKATYNVKGRPGMFDKSITVKTNITTEGNDTVRLTIKGEVIPAPAAPADPAPAQ